jgi:hypothetical protein
VDCAVSTDPSVAGYNVYYGGASGAYTNEISVGNATNATISGITSDATNDRLLDWAHLDTTKFGLTGRFALPSLVAVSRCRPS